VSDDFERTSDAFERETDRADFLQRRTKDAFYKLLEQAREGKPIDPKEVDQAIDDAIYVAALTN
jgi:hypothetical protein